jgi:hypothetical protein
VKEFAEEPVVSKQARVVEEVRIRKDATERTETVRDSVRRTEVNVENVGESTGGTDTGAIRQSERAAATGTAAGTALGANEAEFRQHYTSTYGTSGEGYDTYRPGYTYGYEMASDPRYQGRSFDDIEPELRNEYSRRYPNSTWERMKDSVRYGWNKVTGKV